MFPRNGGMFSPATFAGTSGDGQTTSIRGPLSLANPHGNIRKPTTTIQENRPLIAQERSHEFVLLNLLCPVRQSFNTPP